MIYKYAMNAMASSQGTSSSNEPTGIDIVKHEFWVWNQKQLLSLILIVLICLIVSLIVFIKIKKEARKDKAPKGLLFVMEGYVNYIDNAYDDNTDTKLPKARFYVFGLATFLFVGNLLGLIGFEPVTTSYSVALTCGLITFLGIYVIGFMYQKWRFFKRYINPIEIIGQFSPLISISFRIFGNIIGGAVIIYLIYYVFGFVWVKMTGQPNFDYAVTHNQAWPLLAPLITPFLHMYFDMFSAFIQALVFCSLTTIWWAQEVEVDEKEVKEANKSITKNGLEDSLNVNNSKSLTLNQNIY
ncbi:F0F1 ATP synthase subunit A [Mycoplasmopsis adleri]|uniref:F0F1 ATP synthase subunit A n=1 Tax=Mycoplasmopsis adleri TaxID=51362 RepID=UPI00387354D4